MFYFMYPGENPLCIIFKEERIKNGKENSSGSDKHV